MSTCDMGKLNVVLSDKVEDSFRKTVAINKGLKKGYISEAFEEAVVLWIDNNAAADHKKRK